MAETPVKPTGTGYGHRSLTTSGRALGQHHVAGRDVAGEGKGHSGAIVVGGVDDAASSSLVLAARISSSGRFDTVFGTNGIVEYPVHSVNGSGPSAEITNVSLGGAHSTLPDVILSGFSFTKGTKAGSSAKATALTVAVKDRTGALDTNFNGTRRDDQPQLRQGGTGPA